jgi:hypothetical protein
MKTYHEVADKHELTGDTKLLFLAYMAWRWPDKKDQAIKCQVGYAGEWAERFKSGHEYTASDHEGQAVLRRLSSKY